MGKKKQVDPDDPEQYARFVKVAEEHLEEDAEERFEEAIRKILPPKGPEPDQDSDH